ncbi:MAG: hypothetical protein IT208_09745 [Chthonomonadales bacterium]|nr:hypothetical protein [Chthonomonadales bacterium]
MKPRPAVRAALLVIAVLVLVTLATFWRWVDSLRPPPGWTRAAYETLQADLEALPADTVVPPAVVERAHGLGVNPAPDMAAITEEQHGTTRPLASAGVWRRAVARAAAAADTARIAYERMRSWRLAVAAATLSVAALLAALALLPPPGRPEPPSAAEPPEPGT